MKLVLSLIILIGGLAVGWFYLRRPPIRAKRQAASRSDERPWRRLGAGICVVLAIMFVAGLYLLDADRKPGSYVTYWLVMMMLVLWLCLLVLRDLLYTRHMIARWKKNLNDDWPAEPANAAQKETDS